MGKSFIGGSNIESNKVKHLKIPFKFKYITSDIMVTVEAFELVGIQKNVSKWNTFIGHSDNDIE
jgi:hypothetical protein